jgi:hypothetical protein
MTRSTTTERTIRSLASKQTALLRVGKPLGRKTTVTRKEAEAWLVDKAETDAAFRRALLAKPTETIARELGIAFPAGVKVRVVQESERELILVLPAPASLGDAELDRVVGGATKEAEKSNKVVALTSGVPAAKATTAAQKAHAAE